MAKRKEGSASADKASTFVKEQVESLKEKAGTQLEHVARQGGGGCRRPYEDGKAAAAELYEKGKEGLGQVYDDVISPEHTEGGDQQGWSFGPGVTCTDSGSTGRQLPPHPPLQATQLSCLTFV
jgi:hypothetical protein